MERFLAGWDHVMKRRWQVWSDIIRLGGHSQDKTRQRLCRAASEQATEVPQASAACVPCSRMLVW